MVTPQFRLLLEAYHRKKWFPDRYPDPYEEFIDYVSEGTIRDFITEWERTKNPKALHIAYYIYRILPTISLGDLFNEYRRAMAQNLPGQRITAEFVFYYLRSFPEDRANLLWQEFHDWTVRWDSVLHNWSQSVINLERKFPAFPAHSNKQDPASVEKELLSSRELFGRLMKKRTTGQTLADLLRAFRLPDWDEIAEWNDFPAFAKSTAATCLIKSLPSIRKSRSQDAVQILFPIAPPKRVILEYGKAAGPADFLRFLFELGKGFSLAGMNPELAAEDRICGDPALPLFWGFVYSHLLSDSTSIKRVVNLKAEKLAEEMRFILHFQHRYDTVLALYRDRVNSEFKDVQDLYVTLFESAFPFPAPHFLYLFDLDRARESGSHVTAFRSAAAAVERFRELYGRLWFSTERFARRVRNYWWEGYRLSLTDILQDLSVPTAGSIPLP
jgi:hypothetical protein